MRGIYGGQIESLFQTVSLRSWPAIGRKDGGPGCPPFGRREWLLWDGILTSKQRQISIKHTRSQCLSFPRSPLANSVTINEGNMGFRSPAVCIYLGNASNPLSSCVRLREPDAPKMPQSRRWILFIPIIPWLETPPDSTQWPQGYLPWF